MYRIVQEALTNVIKHAGPCRAAVTVTRTPEWLDVLVADDGRGGTPPAASGHGLAGMCERAALYDGQLTADRGNRRLPRARPVPRRRRSRHVTGKIRVVVASDEALVRDGLRAIAELEGDIAIVGDAATGGEAVQLARTLHPDVVLMDIRMPGMDGLAATRAIMCDPGPPRVIVLTIFDTDEFVYQAMKAGASGFLLKDVRRGQLASAIRTRGRRGHPACPGDHRRLEGLPAARTRRGSPSASQPDLA